MFYFLFGGKYKTSYLLRKGADNFMKKLQRFVACVLAGAMSLTSTPLSALAVDAEPEVTTYYVASSKHETPGSDSNDGSIDSPLLSFRGAINKAKEENVEHLRIEMLSDIELSNTYRFDGFDISNLTVDGNSNNIIYTGQSSLGSIGTGSALVEVVNNANVTFEDVQVTRTYGSNYNAGLVYVNNAIFTSNNSTFSNGQLNVSDQIDGGSAIQVADGAHVYLTNGTVIENNNTIGTKATGAVYVSNNGFLSVNGLTIRNNTDTYRGDAIYAESGSSVEFYPSATNVSNAIDIAEEIYVEVGANVKVGAPQGLSDKIILNNVYLENEPFAIGDAKLATMDITGDTSNSVIGIATHDNYRFKYRLISNQVDGYQISTTLGAKDETGWSDLSNEYDIRYMTYKGVPGLYLYHHTVDATFHNVDTLTGIQGKDIDGSNVSYFNPSEVTNTTNVDGLLTIPEIVPTNGDNYTVTFTVDESNKVYRIPTPDQISVTLDGDTLFANDDYVYTPDYANGTATITVKGTTLNGATGDLHFEISAEKYHLLTLQMHGPLYTMTTDITGQSVDSVMKVYEELSDDGTRLDYYISRGALQTPVEDVTVVIYEENNALKANEGITDSDGHVYFTDLDPNKSYYYIIHYSESFYVISRDTMTIHMSTLEGQKMSDRYDADDKVVTVNYNVADAENYATAQSTITGVKQDTTVTYYVDLAQDTITFDSNPGESTTVDTVTFYFNGAEYNQTVFTKTMETNASSYGNLPDLTMVGYEFVGWYTERVGGKKVETTTPYDTTTSPRVLYAHWIPNGNTQYTIEHWVEYVEHGVNPNYVAGVTRTKVVNGVTYYEWCAPTTNTNTSDVVLDDVLFDRLTDDTGFSTDDYTWWTEKGFTITSDEDCKVLADGSSIFSIYYTRNRYTMTYDPTPGSMTTEIRTRTCVFGAEIGTMLAATLPGYTFTGWHHESDLNAEHVITKTSWYTWTKDSSVYATWRKAQTTYRIRVFTEDMSRDKDGVGYADGTYTQYKYVTTDNAGNLLGAETDKENVYNVNLLDALNITGFTYAGYNLTGETENPTYVVDDTYYRVTPAGDGSTVVCLYFTRNEVDVTFKDDNNIHADDYHKVTITYGDTFQNALPDKNPTKPGYDFVDWLDEDENVITGMTSTNDYTADGDGEMTIYPSWTARTYFLTYVPAEDGSAILNTQHMGVDYTADPDVYGGYVVPYPITYDKLIGTMPTASKLGHEFIGWTLRDGPSAGEYVDSNDIATVDNVVVKNDNNTHEDTYPLYAEFKPFEFTLILDPGEGGTVDPTSVSVTYGQPIPQLPVPVKTGYTFVGWMLDKGSAGLTRIESGDIWDYVTTNGSSVTAHAMYVPNDYKYDLNLNDVTEGNGSTKAYLYDSSVSGVEIPFDGSIYDVIKGISALRDGYTFLGWGTSKELSSIITKDDINTTPSGGTLYALWQPNVYTIEVALNGGELVYREGEVYPDQTLYKDWFNWNEYAQTNYTKYGETYAAFGAKTLVATYNESLDIWYVPIIFDTTYGYIGDLARNGYRFDKYLGVAPNWYLPENEDGEREWAIHLQNITHIEHSYTDGRSSGFQLNAQWTPYFTFTVDGEDGATIVESGDTTYTIARDEIIDLTKLPTAVKEGYTFLGWWDSVKGGYVTWEEVIVLGETRTFVGKFTPNITFVANNDVEGLGRVQVNGEQFETYTIGLDELLKTYTSYFKAVHPTRTFMGWYSDEYDVSSFENLKYRSTPLTINADWDVTITFDLVSGSYWDDNQSTLDRIYTVTEIASMSSLPTVTLDGHKFLGWFDENGNQVSHSDLANAIESMVVRPQFGKIDEEPTGISVTVTNYAGNNAGYIEPDMWVEGENTLRVQANLACGVALVRNGVMTELACTQVSSNAYDFVVNCQDGDEIIITLKGDVNLDGSVDIMDYARLYQFINGTYELDNAGFLASDSNGDNTVDIMDYAHLYQFINGTYAYSWNLIK